MARGMVEVELVGDEPPAGGSGQGPDPATDGLRRAWAAVTRSARRASAVLLSPVLRAWRRPRVRWVAGGAVVAVVAVSVTVPVMNATHERARLAELAQVPGVVRPLHPGLQALLRVPDPDAQVLTQGVPVGDALVSVVWAPDGDRSIVALDTATGTRRWSATLGPVGAPAERVEFPACDVAGAVVLCTATQVADQESLVWGTSLWVLDPADGHVIRAEAYDEHTWATAGRGLAVVARQSSGPPRAPESGPWIVTWEVTGSDPSSGTVRWTWTSPPVTVAAAVEDQNAIHDPTDYFSSFVGLSHWPAPADAVELSVGADTWVLGADGSLLTHLAPPGRWWVTEQRGSLVRSPVTDDATTEDRAPKDQLLADDGTWRPIDGAQPELAVDDGSAPDVLLRTSGTLFAGGRPTVLGVDRHTGATLWQTPIDGATGFGAMVLEGRLYIGSGSLRAIDMATGHVIWSTSADDGPVGALVATDGRVLLVAPSMRGNEVEARSMTDGHVLWRDDLGGAVLPSGEGNLAGIGTQTTLRRLEAYRADQSVVVLG